MEIQILESSGSRLGTVPLESRKETLTSITEKLKRNVDSLSSVVAELEESLGPITFGPAIQGTAQRQGELVVEEQSESQFPSPFPEPLIPEGLKTLDELNEDVAELVHRINSLRNRLAL